RLTANGTVTVLHRFVGATDGGAPNGGLIQGSDGRLYGTTNTSGPHGFGTVFALSLAGAFAVLHGFVGSPDGAQPYGGLIQLSDGNFYGTTSHGGSIPGGGGNYGTLFSISTDGTEQVLFNFSGSSSNPTGIGPLASLTNGGNGVIYGTTEGGGPPP